MAKKLGKPKLHIYKLNQKPFFNYPNDGNGIVTTEKQQVLMPGNVAVKGENKKIDNNEVIVTNNDKMDDLNVDNISVDLMAGGQTQGEMANFFANSGGLNLMAMRPWIGKCGNNFITVFKGGDPKNISSYAAKQVNTNATLRQDEWKALDEAVLAVARERLVGIADLEANNLTYPLGNAMGTTILRYDDVSDAFEAVLTMDGVTRSMGDRPVFTAKLLPIPILHSDYEINLRTLESSRRMGDSLEVIYAERAARRIAEKLEDMLFSDTSYSFGGGTIYSYLNFPNRNQVALAVAWDTATPAQILADVLIMKQASIGTKHHGPWMLYIPTDYETAMDSDFDTTAGITMRERLLKIGGIKGIKVADRLADDTVLLIEMRKQTVRLVTGIPISNIQWNTEGNFIHKHKVITIQVPQIRSDQDGNSGIVHLA